jgi:hypothetical protein
MNSEKTEKYTMDYLLELLEGYKYYSREQIYYVYHHLNGNEEQAKFYLDLCEEQNKKIKKCMDKLQNQ